MKKLKDIKFIIKLIFVVYVCIGIALVVLLLL